MSSLYVALLLALQLTFNTSFPQRLYYEQLELMDVMQQQAASLTDLLIQYTQQGLQDTSQYKQLREKQDLLQRTLDSGRLQLRDPVDTLTLEKLESIQTVLLQTLAELTETPVKEHVAQDRAQQRGEALQQIDDFIRRQQDLSNQATHTDQRLNRLEQQQKLTGEVTTTMLEIAQRTPDVASILQRAAQSMKLAERQLKAGNEERANQYQRTASQQLQDARRGLQQHLTENINEEDVSKREAESQLSQLAELAQTQMELSDRIGKLLPDLPPTEQLKALHQQRSLSRQLAQFGNQINTDQSAFNAADSAMQDAVDALTSGSPQVAQQHMSRVVQSIQSMATNAMHELDLSGENEQILQIAQSIISEKTLREIAQQLSMVSDLTPTMQQHIAEARRASSNDEVAQALRQSIYQDLVQLLRNRLNPSVNNQKQAMSPGDDELLFAPAEESAAEPVWQPDIGQLEAKLQQAMERPDAGAYAKLLRAYYNKIAETGK